MDISLLLFSFGALVVGLCIGSFLNACVYRIMHGIPMMRLHTRSVCPYCHKQLRARDLVPLFSYFFLRGNCRSCHQPISMHYPIMEFLTGMTWYAVVMRFGFTPTTLIILVDVTILLTLFLVDVLYLVLPDRMTIPAIVVVLIFAFLQHVSIPSILIGTALGGGFFLLQWIISRGRWIGSGDIRFGVLIGCMIGWPLILAALFLTYVIGASVGVLLLAMGRAKRTTQLPLGAFIAVGTIITLLYGSSLIDWYRQFLIV